MILYSITKHNLYTGFITRYESPLFSVFKQMRIYFVISIVFLSCHREVFSCCNLIVSQRFIKCKSV